MKKRVFIMKLFHICTISNKLEQYQEMKASFLKAGFDEDRCRYTLFDNSKTNIYDPYETFNTVKSNTVEPYIIFCHQDILLNQGDGVERLINLLEILEQLDPKWAIIGNAGVNNNYRFVIRITDPNLSPNWLGDFPQPVHSLDENFLVIKSCVNISCSDKLKGFHFYGTDLCLNAISCGYSCYVIDFHLTHLSGGNYLSKAFRDTQEIFYREWCNKFNFCYVKTLTGATMCLSKYKTMRLIGTYHRIAKFFITSNWIHSFINPH